MTALMVTGQQPGGLKSSVASTILPTQPGCECWRGACRSCHGTVVLIVLPSDVQAHLAPFLPTHPLHPTGAMPGFKSDDKSFGAMAAAPYGSSLILPISYAYISMMGSDGLTEVCPVTL